MCKSLKLVRVDSTDEDSVDAIVRQIRSEVQNTTCHNAVYDLSKFTYSHTLRQTSKTLLQLVSELVSNGDVSKISMSLAQAVQSHITGTRNQTTLGLAVKLHHKYGSSELIQLLYDHGFTTSYDELIRFRKSAAKFVSSEGSVLQEAMCLSQRVGSMFGWFDNFTSQCQHPMVAEKHMLWPMSSKWIPLVSLRKVRRSPGWWTWKFHVCLKVHVIPSTTCQPSHYNIIQGLGKWTPQRLP